MKNFIINNKEMLCSLHPNNRQIIEELESLDDKIKEIITDEDAAAHGT